MAIRNKEPGPSANRSAPISFWDERLAPRRSAFRPLRSTASHHQIEHKNAPETEKRHQQHACLQRSSAAILFARHEACVARPWLPSKPGRNWGSMAMHHVRLQLINVKKAQRTIDDNDRSKDREQYASSFTKYGRWGVVSCDFFRHSRILDRAAAIQPETFVSAPHNRYAVRSARQAVRHGIAAGRRHGL
jgi:hypothetical protein